MLSNLGKNGDTVVIIGGGIQGLVLAYKLSKYGYKPVVLEAEKQVGGLLGQETLQGITIDKFYHHYFLTDKYFIRLLQELNLTHRLFFKDFKASYGSTGNSLQESLLLGLLLLSPTYKLWENIPVKLLFKLFALNNKTGLGGLLYKKFSFDYKNITSAWLWARIHARYNMVRALRAKLTGKERLYFLKPSASVLIDALVKRIKSAHGVIKTGINVQNLGAIIVGYNPKHIVFTTPLPITYRILQNTLLHVSDFITPAKGEHIQIDMQEISRWLRETLIPKYKAAINAIVIVKKRTSQTQSVSKNIEALSKEKESYWSHLPDEFAPFLVKVAQHIAYADLKYKIYYLGAYVDQDEIVKAKEFLAKNITRMLKINQKDIITIKIEVATYAAHVPTVEYIKHLPKIKIGHLRVNLYPHNNDAVAKEDTTKGILLWSSSFGQLHPWDRGTNYAIYQAEQVTRQIVRAKV